VDSLGTTPLFPRRGFHDHTVLILHEPHNTLAAGALCSARRAGSSTGSSNCQVAVAWTPVTVDFFFDLQARQALQVRASMTAARLACEAEVLPTPESGL
jgi:hypothetical protein